MALNLNMAVGRTALLVIVCFTGVGVALILTFTLVPKLFADLSSSSAAATEQQEAQRLIENTKDLPEVKEFLHFYPDSKAKVVDGRSGTSAIGGGGSSKEEAVVKYSYEKKYYDRNFIQTARLFVMLDCSKQQGKDSGDSFNIVRYNCLKYSSSGSDGGAAVLSYDVYMDCGATGFDFENNLEGSGMSSYSNYGNVTKFVTDSRCAR